MTVTEAVAKAKELFGIEPSAAYKGIETADDFVFAVQTDTTNQAAEGNWIVCADHVKEHSTLTELRAGDNWLLLSADAGETALQAEISFYPMYAGILPEVISNAT